MWFDSRLEATDGSTTGSTPGSTTCSIPRSEHATCARMRSATVSRAASIRVEATRAREGWSNHRVSVHGPYRIQFRGSCLVQWLITRTARSELLTRFWHAVRRLRDSIAGAIRYRVLPCESCGLRWRRPRLTERSNQARVVSEGKFLISSTRLRGAFSLRMATLGFRTTMDDIRALFAAIESALAAEMKSF